MQEGDSATDILQTPTLARAIATQGAVANGGVAATSTCQGAAGGRAIAAQGAVADGGCTVADENRAAGVATAIIAKGTGRDADGAPCVNRTGIDSPCITAKGAGRNGEIGINAATHPDRPPHTGGIGAEGATRNGGIA